MGSGKGGVANKFTLLVTETETKIDKMVKESNENLC